MIQFRIKYFQGLKINFKVLKPLLQVRSLQVSKMKNTIICREKGAKNAFSKDVFLTKLKP